jgi:hypothetical protein
MSGVANKILTIAAAVAQPSSLTLEPPSFGSQSCSFFIDADALSGASVY